ncbi:hypothetical protein HYR69_10750 [Candidatus Sumerlaeota bacterium]|nr:hypothetical protein [Candidatus Sumerlaeota bacterium]MBI3735047.1 hypothetical protein [Candidatus Sumerlaeota bacterium]
MTPGQHLLVTLRARNKGIVTWTPEGSYALSAIVDDCAMLDAAAFAVPSPIEPSGSLDFLIQLTAPGSSGVCNLQFRMRHGLGGEFGTVFSRVIQIADPPNSARDWTLYE